MSLAAGAKIKSRWDAVKRKGVEFFDETDRKLVEELFTLLGDVGLFVVPCGELEGWLRLGIAKDPQWIGWPLRNFIGETARTI